EKPDTRKDGGPTAHAMFRLRPEHWNQVMPDYSLGWAENNRQACLCNLGPLSSVGRAFGTLASGKEGNEEAARRGARVLRFADRLHTVHFFCPEGGLYLLSPDGKSMTCSFHGSALHPRQETKPLEGGFK